MNSINKEEIITAVRRHYSKTKTTVSENNYCCTSDSNCCNSTILESGESGITKIFNYSQDDIQLVPKETLRSLGCGNPGAIADIKPGETVLDLGSGGGIDCFIAAQKVKNNGFVIGIDMTPEMINKARETAKRNHCNNIDFRLGEIENLPVADSSVDVIISNCVINLSPDKPRVFSEAFRILKKGGRFRISDMVAKAPLPDKICEDLNLYVSCISGAVFIDDLIKMIGDAGFENIEIQLKEKDQISQNDCAQGTQAEDIVTSAIIKADKPF